MERFHPPVTYDSSVVAATFVTDSRCTLVLPRGAGWHRARTPSNSPATDDAPSDRMILVDTSVWVDYLRRGNTGLRQLLDDAEVACHPFVIGELACGTLRNRDAILNMLAHLPGAPVAEHREVLALVGARHLMGRGLGWVDAHLLASALLAESQLWTLDRSLNGAAERLRIAVTS